MAKTILLSTWKEFLMKCRACDEILTNIEATRKDQYNEFIDLCNICLSKSDFVESDVTLDQVSRLYDETS